MTINDMDNLWALLGTLRPGDPRLKNTALKEAWAMVLRPYPPGDVGRAVSAYFRENKFWPDVTDIATRCPAPQCAVDAKTRQAVEELKALYAQLKAGGWLD